MNTTDDNSKIRGDISTDGGDQAIRLTGSMLGPQRHICAFIHSADEEYGVMLPFIERGFECGDRAYQVVLSKASGGPPNYI